MTGRHPYRETIAFVDRDCARDRSVGRFEARLRVDRAIRVLKLVAALVVIFSTTTLISLASDGAFGHR